MTNDPLLPIELYRQIVGDPILEKRDLLQLTLASRALSAEAYPLLYNTVTLKDVQSATLAIHTLSSIKELSRLVHNLVLRIGPGEFEDLWLAFSQQLVLAINNLTNLKELTLNYLWAANPGGAPRGKRAAWTRALSLRQIETLRIETSTNKPFKEIFGQLPTPLPKLQTMRPLQVDWMQGIAHVHCERIFGRATEPLVSLRRLEVYNMESFALGEEEWAPNLETLALVSAYVSTRNFGWCETWARNFQLYKHVKSIGPCLFNGADEAYSLCTAHMPNLEVILLVMTRIDWRNFNVAAAEKMLSSSPNLRKVSVARAEFGDLNGKIKQVKTFTREVDLKEPKWNETIEGVVAADWKNTLETLLELN